jgi:hypothetical protein
MKKFKVISEAPRLRVAYNALTYLYKDLHDITWDHSVWENDDCVAINSSSEYYDFVLYETNNPDKPFWLSPNLHDPENPVTPEKMAESLIEMMEEALPDPDNPGISIIPDSSEVTIESFIGAYVSTIEEAVENVSRWLKMPVAEWPKDYDKPLRKL